MNAIANLHNKVGVRVSIELFRFYKGPFLLGFWFWRRPACLGRSSRIEALFGWTSKGEFRRIFVKKGHVSTHFFQYNYVQLLNYNRKYFEINLYKISGTRLRAGQDRKVHWSHAEESC